MMKEMPLGRQAPWPETYDPSVLYPIPRGGSRPGMHGFDLWRAYELSWLDGKGKPEAAMLQLVYPLASRNIVESKSLKLYLHGVANTAFAGRDELLETIRCDLEAILAAPWVHVSLLADRQGPATDWVHDLPGVCIDGLDIGGFPDRIDPGVLKAQENRKTESLHSHLLKTSCPITGQPDWASVLVEYRGKGIDHASLLEYLCSYRGHRGFSEECCERIFQDIDQACSPESLAVSCFYTRRGGIDINPVRSSYEKNPEESARYRLLRQ
ncbi:MAG: NADPH-dependent 7-cyano-7-deazaguanine reductase QueF [Deltaproteobacteria bacterium]|jgi:7-cyano-7-deazaguanine reductase|nr:NADPH-dependent 7-cyano-7-deazaguanine reductase QueF [Deltaproteobacteria bacterium]MDX9762595.1 NADPH-dependent 7-cyano-7-deazaguanine reductase QueF [Desulfomonilia bacterium]